jgi:sugar (pentulose or hexulose) kinase
MDCYLGIDIGTTNTKALALLSDGTSEIVYADATPKYRREGIEYFTLPSIEQNVLNAIDKTAKAFEVKGISFSSVGESVVPVAVPKNGGELPNAPESQSEAQSQAICDPIVWYDGVTRPIEAELRERGVLGAFELRGVQSDHTMGLYKMVEMQRNELRNCVQDYTFLPLADYFPYLLTGKMHWDYSQACRSFVFDIHARRWDRVAMQAAGLTVDLPEPVPTGAQIGLFRDSVPVFIGGHDHIVGMYGSTMLFGDNTLFYSMGSAAVLGGFISDAHPELGPLMQADLQANQKLTVGVSHEHVEYYVENSLRYFGKLHDAVAYLLGGKSPKEFYDQLNPLIEVVEKDQQLPCLIVEGDRIAEERIEGFQLRGLKIGDTPQKIGHALYVYLGLMSAIIMEELSSYFPEPEIVVGGGIVQNRLMLQYIVDIIGRPIRILQERELSALGAALTAAYGQSDETVIQQIRQNIDSELIHPSECAESRRRLAEQMHASAQSAFT